MNITDELKSSCDPDELLCQNPQTGKLWPQDFIDPKTGNATHCMTCNLTCPAPTPPPKGSSSGRNLPAASMTLVVYLILLAILA